MKLRREAIQALDAQLEMIKFYGSDTGRLFTRGFVYDMSRIDNNDPEKYAIETGDLLSSNLANSLNKADTYYITEDMLALNLHAGESMSMTPFRPDDLPTPTGFVLLPEAVVVRDVHNKRVSARAFAWWPGIINVKATTADMPLYGSESIETPALFLALFSNKNDWDVDDYTAEEYHQNKEQWLREPQWALMHWMPIHFGTDWAPPDIEEWPVLTTKLKDDAGNASTGFMYNWLAFLKSFFLLVKQEIAVLNPEHPDRSTFRRWKGSGLMPEFGDIKIVTLRRKRPRNEDTSVGSAEVEWSHRWIVSGFWRKKPYHPSCPTCSSLHEGCGQHEEVWIEAFEKGPLNKPLIVKDRVFVWRR